VPLGILGLQECKANGNAPHTPLVALGAAKGGVNLSACRRDLSFDFTQDGEPVEPPVPMIGSRSFLLQGRREAVAPYSIRG